ncbi:MAG: Glu/Leu/Phe/Val dehydrogenase dimerization domain-containing protein [Actinomycetota bacterium]
MTEHDVFDLVEQGGHETVAFCHDEATGLRAIIAVHSTVLGPGLGGTRFWPYRSEREALVDVLRLSRGMTYKNAAAGLDLGGGKAVIIGDPRRDRTDDLIRAYGRAVHGQGGRYLTAEDVGTTQADLDLIRTVTPYATGTTDGSGDPSPATAWGVFWAMKAVAAHLWGSDSLEGRTVAVSGVGKVGSALVGHLVEGGAKVLVADMRDIAVEAMVAAHGATAVATDEIHRAPVDILSPCALGATLNGVTIPEMRCAAVCGCANNQLAEPEDAVRLAEAGILYAPDFVVNAGGVINIAEELRGYERQRAYERIRGIGAAIGRILATAEEHGITTEEAAEHVAEERLQNERRDKGER